MKYMHEALVDIDHVRCVAAIILLYMTILSAFSILSIMAMPSIQSRSYRWYLVSPHSVVLERSHSLINHERIAIAGPAAVAAVINQLRRVEYTV